IYCEVDSILPDKPEFDFLRDRHYRIKTIKLRGQISQGLVLDIALHLGKEALKFEVNQDVTELLGVTKYLPPEERETEKKKTEPPRKGLAKWLMRFAWYRKMVFKRNGKKPFPEWIEKTDENRIQNAFNYEELQTYTFSATEKMDGQSGTYYYRQHRYGICSRNYEVSIKDKSNYSQIYQAKGMKQLLKYCFKQGKQSVVIQGEVCGEKIQGNPYKIKGIELFIFHLYLDGKLLSYSEMNKLIEEYNQKYQGTFQLVPLVEASFQLPSLSDLVLKSNGQSLYNPIVKREGIVIRSNPGSPGCSFKVLSPEYLLTAEQE
ncbi:hypothetical protein EZS27_018031, partial [termite gut metagenome]